MSVNREDAVVEYCGYGGAFRADLYFVAGVVIVRAAEPVKPENLLRGAYTATHHLIDFPVQGIWHPDIGVFVIPESQCKEVNTMKKLRLNLEELQITSFDAGGGIVGYGTTGGPITPASQHCEGPGPYSKEKNCSGWCISGRCR